MYGDLSLDVDLFCILFHESGHHEAHKPTSKFVYSNPEHDSTQTHMHAVGSHCYLVSFLYLGLKLKTTQLAGTVSILSRLLVLYVQ